MDVGEHNMRTKDMKSLMDAYNQVILGESVEIDEARQMKDPKKDSMVSKGGKTIVIDKSKEKEYLKKGWSLAEKKKLDPVDDKANDKKFVNRKDKDIDNDGDVDSSDEYLHKRRKATDDAIDGGKKPAKNEGKRGFIKAAKDAKAKGEKDFMFAGKKYNCEDALNGDEEESEDKPKKKNPFPPKKDGEEKDEKDSEDKDDDKESDDKESDDEEEKDVPKVAGKKDDKKKVASNAKTAEISKIGENSADAKAAGVGRTGETYRDRMKRLGKTQSESVDLVDAIKDLHKMWESAAKKSVKGVTDKGEEIDSKQSPKSKEFDNSHDKSDKKVEDNVEDAKKKNKVAQDATKAKSGKRPVDHEVGDKNVVKSTEVKEDAEQVVKQAQDIIQGKTMSEIADLNSEKPKNPHDARTREAKAFLKRMAKKQGTV